MNEQTNKTENERSPETSQPLYSPPIDYNKNYSSNYNQPYPSYGYNDPAYPQYYPAIVPRPNPLVQIVFWFFYLTVGLPVSFSLTLALWATALGLIIVFPLTVLKQTGVIGGNWVSLGDWLSQQSEALVYGLTGCISIVGLLLLVFAVLTTRPWLGLHRAVLRNLGGLNI